MHLIVVSTHDRSHICTDDRNCDFRTCDPASLLRHRKCLHGYIPRAKSGKSKPSTAVSHHASESSSSGNPFSKPFSPPATTLPLPSTSSPSYFFPSSSSSHSFNNSESQIPDNDTNIICQLRRLSSEDPDSKAFFGLIDDLNSLDSPSLPSDIMINSPFLRLDW